MIIQVLLCLSCLGVDDYSIQPQLVLCNLHLEASTLSSNTLSTRVSDTLAMLLFYHEALNMVRRSLKVINLEDYGETTANRGHDPWNYRASGGGNNAGRKG
ncbi:hypothetical protein VNO77_43316 [Canavalia gladiata]|uniref:Uncharacterized protein n=1 Tax=Canavalia gladiata TaxID=3824 RepID=A0AAN9JU00_CANGL